MRAKNLTVLAAGAVVTACALPPPTVNTAPASQPAPATSAAATAHVGDTVNLTGLDQGAKMAVTVVKVISRARPTDSFMTPSHGMRFYAVQFRLANTGSVAYSDSPFNGARVVDSQGQSYDADFSDVKGCHSFPGTENIMTGASGLGCVVFQVPKSATITQIQFALDSGTADDTGQWAVP
jgi:hypothetical protein